MISSLSIYDHPLWVCVVLSWCVVDKFYFWYFVERVISYHGGTDALADAAELDADIPQEGAACSLSHDHDCFRVHFGQIEYHGKP